MIYEEKIMVTSVYIMSLLKLYRYSLNLSFTFCCRIFKALFSVDTLRREIARGRLKATRIGRLIFVTDANAQAYLEWRATMPIHPRRHHLHHHPTRAPIRLRFWSRRIRTTTVRSLGTDDLRTAEIRAHELAARETTPAEQPAERLMVGELLARDWHCTPSISRAPRPIGTCAATSSALPSATSPSPS